MKILSMTVVCLGFFLSTHLASSQEGKVVVVYPESRELKRTARQLRISVEQLKNARQALEDASELVRRVDDVSREHYSGVGEAWVRLNPKKAVVAIEGLVLHLRSRAQAATELQQYQNCTMVAHELLAAMSRLDSERSMELFTQWPRPPARLGAEAEKGAAELERSLRSRILAMLTPRDPERALAWLNELSPTVAPDYGDRGRLVLLLMSRGKTDQGQKIVREVMTDFARRNPDQRAVQEYSRFVSQLRLVDGSRMSDALSLLLRTVSKPDLASMSGGGTLKIGDRTVHLTYPEALVLSMLKDMRGSPELAIKTVEAIPGLNAKLVQVGGIESFMNYGSGAGMSLSYGDASGVQFSLGIHPQPPPTTPPAGPSTAVDVMNVQLELQGKALKNPSLVRQRLSRLAEDSENLDILLSIAQGALHEDPDLSALAMEYARPLVLQAQPLSRRLMLFERFMDLSRQCEGEVDIDFLREGFVLAAEIREDEEQKSAETPGPARRYSLADNLELALIAEVARSDFNAARRYLGSISDETKRLRALLRIVQTLQQP